MLDDSMGIDDQDIMIRNEEGPHSARRSAYGFRDIDENLRYFHNLINKIRKRNKIQGCDHRWRMEGKEKSIRPRLIYGFTPRKVSDEDNVMLITPFAEKEVKTAFWACDISRSPGPDEENTKFINRFLKNVEAVSRLKINRDKCVVYGIQVEENKLGDLANIVGCQVGQVPFVYLGTMVWAVMSASTGWSDVVNKVRNWLRRWEGLNISMGGRITLNNAVLSSIPVYYMSIF
ncbi:hypothetical protein ACS0TY_021696 [Phlomoides rotata]